MTTRIYTKTGDAGETGLYGGQRVKKDDVRVAAYGTVDELNAALGGVRAAITLDTSGAGTPGAARYAGLDAHLAALQSLLFDLGAELATPPQRQRRPVDLPASAAGWMEKQIDAYEATLAELKAFILPGGTPVAAALHVARAVCRRAERAVVTLQQADAATLPLCIVLLNRLSDLLFVMARWANHQAGVADVPWQKTNVWHGSSST